MLACQSIKNELLAASHKGIRFPVMFIPQQYHTLPEKLNDYLQNIIERLTNVDFILLPMGQCGNGTVGLKSESASIVLPKCGDCIDLLLSDEKLCSCRPPHNYFLTEGWLNNVNSIDTEYRKMMEKYGKKLTTEMMKMIYKQYDYFTFVDTKTYDLKTAIESIKPLADTVNVEINKMPGSYGVLSKMMRLDFDDNFIITPPGSKVEEAHFH
jgi:hypothetical protein